MDFNRIFNSIKSLNAQKQIPFLKNLITFIYLNVIGKVCGLMVLWTIAKIWGPTSVGEYGLGLYLGLMLSLFSDMGYNQILTREVARNPVEGKSLFWIFIHLRFPWILSSFSIFFLFLPMNFFSVPILCFMAAGLLNTFNEYFYAWLRGMEDIRSLFILDNIYKICSMGIVVLAAFYGLSFSECAWMYLEWALSCGFISFLFLNRKHFLTDVMRVQGISPDRKFVFKKEARYLGILYFAMIVFERMDLLFIQHFSSMEWVGIYTISIKILEVAKVLMDGVFKSFLIYFSKKSPEWCWDQSNFSPKQTFLCLRICIYSCLPAYWVCPGFVHFFFGDTYARSVLPLQIMIWLIPAMTLNYTFNAYLFSTGKQKRVTIFSLAALCLGALLSWALIPRWGLVGAAVSALISQWVLFFGMLSELQVKSIFSSLLIRWNSPFWECMLWMGLALMVPSPGILTVLLFTTLLIFYNLPFVRERG